MGHQVDISFYLKKATTLPHSKELASLEPPWCILNLISLMVPKPWNQLYLIQSPYVYASIDFWL